MNNFSTKISKSVVISDFNFCTIHREGGVDAVDRFFKFTYPLQHRVVSAQLCSPGPQTQEAPRRRPSSLGGTGSPQSSDNEHSSGRLEADTGRRRVLLWQSKSNKHIGFHPTLAFRQSRIIDMQSHLLFFFLAPPAFSDIRCLKTAAMSEIGEQLELEDMYHTSCSELAEEQIGYGANLSGNNSSIFLLHSPLEGRLLIHINM